MILSDEIKTGDRIEIGAHEGEIEIKQVK